MRIPDWYASVRTVGVASVAYVEDATLSKGLAEEWAPVVLAEQCTDVGAVRNAYREPVAAGADKAWVKSSQRSTTYSKVARQLSSCSVWWSQCGRGWFCLRMPPLRGSIL